MKRDKELQRYFDGELDVATAREVFRRLQSDPGEHERYQELVQLRQMMQEANEEATAEANFDYLWTRVEAGIASEEPAPASRGIWAWLRRNRLAAGIPASAALVGASLLLVFTLLPGTPVSNDCVIESLEVGPNAMSTIFTIDDPEESGETTVIWISEQDTEGET